MNATNILKYEHALIDAGVSEKQAEIHAIHLAEIISNTLATKEDLIHLKNEIIIKMSAITGSMIVIGISILGFIIKFS